MKKMDRNELMYKIETDSQISRKTTYSYQRGEVEERGTN